MRVIEKNDSTYSYVCQSGFPAVKLNASAGGETVFLSRRNMSNSPLTPIITSVTISSTGEGAATIKNKTSKEMIAIIEADGWTLDRIRGDHHQFVHKTKPGLVTIPHPEKNLGSWLINKILVQAGLK